MNRKIYVRPHRRKKPNGGYTTVRSHTREVGGSRGIYNQIRSQTLKNKLIDTGLKEKLDRLENGEDAQLNKTELELLGEIFADMNITGWVENVNEESQTFAIADEYPQGGLFPRDGENFDTIERFERMFPNINQVLQWSEYHHEVLPNVGPVEQETQHIKFQINKGD